MIVKEITGDLIKTNCTNIAHGCNAQGVMGSGVARAIRTTWPLAYTKYRKAFELRGNLKLGSVIIVPCKDKVIFNCITQKNYGGDGRLYLDYGSLKTCFVRLNNILHGNELAIPMIGAGLAGGDWNIIKDIINSETPNLDIHVYKL